MLFFAFIVVLCVVGHVNAAWYAGRQVNTLLGVTTGKNNKNEVYGAGYDGTDGFVFYSGDRANLPGTTIKVGTGINFDITINEDKTDLVVVGANAIYYGKPEGASSKFAKAPFTNVVSQDVQPIKGTGNKIAAIGRFDGTNGVAVTCDGGATWQSKDIGSSEESGLLARYGSFPSANTWYVSAGTWPWDSDARLTNGNVARVSARLSIFYDIGDGTPQTTFLSAKKLLGTYPGAIFKTTDGGNTWNQVYNSGGKHYLNQIDCVSESNCVAVGEDAKSAIVLSTTDGGATWQKKLELSGPYSLHAVKMLSANEYFVGGGAPSVGPYQSKEIVGYYYHTTDGGQNFALTQLNGYAYDFTYWDGTQGYAAALFKKNSYVWIWQ